MIKRECYECGTESELNIDPELADQALWECPKCNTRNTFDKEIKTGDKGKAKESK